MLEFFALERLASETGLGDASIVVQPTGDRQAGVELRPENPIYPASMIKVPIAMALALRCDTGSLAYADVVSISETNLTTNDAPSPFVAGSTATLAELNRAMLSHSDNVATNVLIDVLGRTTIGPACDELGLTATGVRRKLSGSLPLIDDPAATGRNTHPAADAARLFHEIDRRGRAGLCRLTSDLEAQIWNDKLSKGWDAGDRFAHKTGDTDEVSHDGGILTLGNGRRFVIVVYTELPSNPDTDGRFAAFARALRTTLER